MSPDWMMTRVIVVSLMICAPVYFFVLMFLLPFQVTPFGNPLWDWLFNYLGVPTVFSITWVALLYFSRYRLANTVYLMRQSTTSVPLRWRIFYGTNAAFVMMFFVLPIITAPVAIIGGLVFAGKVFHSIAVGKFGLGKGAAILSSLVAIALCILPGYIMLAFIPQYLEIWHSILTVWSEFWFGVIYGIAQCLVNALSIGAPVYFVYFAAQEYDKGVYGTVYTQTPTNKIRLFELLLFLIFIILYLPPIPTPFGTISLFMNMPWLFTNYINWISLGIVILMILIRWRLGVKDKSTIGGTSNILIVSMFLLVEIFFKANMLIVTLVIWLAFVLFGLIIIINYVRASPREMY